MSDKTLTLDFPFSPCISHTFRKIGIRSKVTHHNFGGFAGGESNYFGLTRSCNRLGFTNFITVDMSESGRSLDLNPSDITKVETVILWEETIYHDNPYCEEKHIVSYFYTSTDIEQVKSSGKQGTRKIAPSTTTKIELNNC